MFILAAPHLHCCQGFPLLAVSRGQRLLFGLLTVLASLTGGGARAPGHEGFGSCGPRLFQSAGSVVEPRGLGCSEAWGIFSD